MNATADIAAQPRRVDFYLLQGTNPQGIEYFCCRLAEKAWKLGNTVFVRTENEQQAQHLDNLMWSYSDGSFLPHNRLDDKLNDDAPIVIGLKTGPTKGCDLMINLASDIPDQSAHYLRVAEIVNEDPTIKRLGRERYAQYDKNSYALNHHNISA